MILPPDFNQEWAVAQLERYLALTVPVGGGHLYAATPTGPREDVLAQSSVIAPILGFLVPAWRDECRGQRNYEFGREREAAIRAKALLEHADEMAQNLGNADASIAPAHFHSWVWEPARSQWLSGH